MQNKPLAYLDKCNAAFDRPIRLAILGVTGSIGRQTIDLVKRFPEKFQVSAVSVNTKIDEALRLCESVKAKILVVCDEDSAKAAKRLPHSSELKILSGAENMAQVVTRDDVDMVVTATVGYSGLLPTLAAIKAGKDIALANKETLVVAGDYISSLLNDSTSRIFPVDSEHSAIAQCLRGEDLESVSRLIITASGGPFRTFDIDRLNSVTASDALHHPNWNMGAKITIDSATMMNKAFEIIEAHYLFGFSPDKITAVVHPQSIVHSMVEFCDGAIKAQLGTPDMHLPIAYALDMNRRLPGASPKLTLEAMSSLTFEEPDIEKFPCLTFARIALEKKGNSACVINAANEIAVDAFLKRKIKFTDIYRTILFTLDKIAYISHPDIKDYITTNTESRKIAEEYVNSHQII